MRTHRRPVITTGPGPSGRWYTRTRAAAEMGVSLRTIHRWITTGHLTTRHGYINAAELIEAEHQRRTARNPGRPGPRLRPCLTA